MSQQGEQPAAHGDDWWRRLYDDTAPDTGPSSTAESLDDRFGSAAGTVGPPADPPPGPPGTTEPDTVAARTPRVPAPAPGPVPPSAPAVPAGAAVPVPDPRVPERDLTPGPLPARDVPGAPQPPPARSPLPSPEPPVRQRPAAEGPPAADPSAPPAPGPAAVRAPWETPAGSSQPRTFAVPLPPVPAGGPAEREPDAVPAGSGAAQRPVVGHIGKRPPAYEAEPVALPASGPGDLDGPVPDTVLDGARYGTFTLRAASVRGDSARLRGERRREALLTARFGEGEGALVLVAVAGGAGADEHAHRAAADACRWIGDAVARSHTRLSDDIRAGRRGDLKSGLHRLTDRTCGKLRARAAELGLEPDAYTVGLRCLLLPADRACRTRVFFGIGGGGLFRLRDGAWQDLEPLVPGAGAATGGPVVGFGSAPAGGTESEQSPAGDRLTMDLQITTPPSPHTGMPQPPPAEPFRFRASVARPGDTLLLCGNGLAGPMRGEPALAKELAERWTPTEPPGLAGYLADVQLRVEGYGDDRTSAAVWEA